MAASNARRDPRDTTKLENLNSGLAGKFNSNCLGDWSGIVKGLL